MPQGPIGVGDAESQKTFLREQQEFLAEHPELHCLLETVFCRTLGAPSGADVGRMEMLPASDSTVVAFEDKVMADRIVFYLGRVAADDFGELMILSGNGRGIGAYKILRGMYERIVTAAYIAKNPSEARPFADDVAIKKWKLWSNLLEVAPEAEDSVPQELVTVLEAECQRAQAKRKEAYCAKCGQPKTQEAWTRVDLASMAKKSDPQLAALYGSCYLEPTFHSHATAFGLERRLVQTESGVHTFRETSEKEARLALILGHNLLLRLLVLQNEYFHLGFDDQIQARVDAFLSIWRDSPAKK
jgi:Family of unknown function (DUF5677)